MSVSVSGRELDYSIIHSWLTCSCSCCGGCSLREEWATIHLSPPPPLLASRHAADAGGADELSSLACRRGQKKTQCGVRSEKKEEGKNVVIIDVRWPAAGCSFEPLPFASKRRALSFGRQTVPALATAHGGLLFHLGSSEALPSVQHSTTYYSFCTCSSSSLLTALTVICMSTARCLGFIVQLQVHMDQTATRRAS